MVNIEDVKIEEKSSSSSDLEEAVPDSQDLSPQAEQRNKTIKGLSTLRENSSTIRKEIRITNNYLESKWILLIFIIHTIQHSYTNALTVSYKSILYKIIHICML